MSVVKIASRYAKSLLELALEQGKLEQVHSDIQLLGAAAKNRDLLHMLKSPIVHADKKNAVLKALFADKMDALTLAYTTLLVKKGREGYLSEIATEFIGQYKSLKKITSVRITTAEPLADGVLDQIRAKILSSGATTANLDVETKVDPAIIGGFILEFDNKRYDAGVLHKLETLKDSFEKNLYVKEF
jgi:F-type H+-transporting ATPase subunit delta